MTMTTSPAQWTWRASADGAEPRGPSDAPHFAGHHPLVARLLEARGIHDEKAAKAFLDPKLTHMHDPATLPGCTRAARRLKQAVHDKQPVVIYGDYDVDGITASAILYHTLRLAGANVSCYVPHRLDEGYGLNDDAIRKIADGGWQMADGDRPDDTVAGPPPLIVSVDCGITATGPAQTARELGVDLIITDHHHFDLDNLPDAHTLVHPAVGESAYPNTDLCGAGVAYKLAWQFALEWCGCAHEEPGQRGRLPEAFRTLLLDLLAFAALGTVADVVPLVGENRAITMFGLRRIAHTKSDGLNALIDASNLRNKKVDSYHIGFVLGPKLNACGRMGHAKEAVELFTTATSARAKELAEVLHHANEDRRATERDILEEANEQVESFGYASDDKRVLVLAHEDWHPGVVGIVASRLTEKYHRPAVVLGIDASTNTAKGSARSIDGFSIHDAISQCKQHLKTFGGHAMAAGLSLDADKIEAFRAALTEQVNAVLRPEDLVRHVRIDAQAQPADCTLRVFEQLQSLAPFGRSNPRPRLLLPGVTLDRPAQRMGAQGKHLSFTLRTEGRSLRAIAWSQGDLAESLPAGTVIDLVCQPTINAWRGNHSAELHVVDLRLSSVPSQTQARLD